MRPMFCCRRIIERFVPFNFPLTYSCKRAGRSDVSCSENHPCPFDLLIRQTGYFPLAISLKLFPVSVRTVWSFVSER